MVASLNKGEEKEQDGKRRGKAKVSCPPVVSGTLLGRSRSQPRANGQRGIYRPAHLSTALRMWAIQAFLSSLELV